MHSDVLNRITTYDGQRDRPERPTRTLEDSATFSLVGTWEWDFGTGHVTWSDGLYGLLGLKPGEMPARLESFMERVHPEDRPRVQASTDAAKTRGEPLDSEFRIIRADGEVRWIAAKGEIFCDGAGKPAWAAGALFDVTHIREAQRDLAAREERYRALATLNSVGEWRGTSTGEQIECRFWSEFTGQDPEDYQDHGWLAAIHPGDVEWIKGIYFDALELGASAVWSFRVRHHSGQYRWCQSKMLPLKDGQGEIREWIGSIEDIHDRREAEEQARTEGERSRLALEAARMVTWDYDLQTQFVTRSENGAEILGIGSGDVSETEHYVHPDDRQRVMDALRCIQDTGSPLRIRVAGRDGFEPGESCCAICRRALAASSELRLTSPPRRRPSPSTRVSESRSPRLRAGLRPFQRSPGTSSGWQVRKDCSKIVSAGRILRDSRPRRCRAGAGSMRSILLTASGCAMPC
ncbi:PAS domain-containing protein [Alsobacter sp. SYSU BS001988]